MALLHVDPSGEDITSEAFVPFLDRLPGLGKTLLVNFILAAAYFTTARLGLAFAIPPGNATAVWPPSGIALGVLLLCGTRVTPGVWIGSFCANMGTGVAATVSLAFATGNTLEALIAMALCRRLLRIEMPFRQVDCGFRLLMLAAFACTVAATVGATSLLWSGNIDERQFVSNWSTWWLGDLAGVMLITPIFIMLPQVGTRQFSSRSVALGALSLLGLGFVSQLTFGGWLPEGLAEGLLYLPLIFVFWMLLRLEPILVLAGNLLIAGIAILYTSQSIGPFATEAVSESLLDLQLFMTIYSLAALTLLGVLSSQRQAEKREAQLAVKIQADEKLHQKETELAHVSRLSTMGELVAGIAHEINQPLYAISNFASASRNLLQESDHATSDELRSLNGQIADQAVRAGEIIKSLRSFIQKTDDRREVFPISDAITDAYQLLLAEAKQKAVTVNIEVSDDPSIRVNADRIQIEQVLVNLIRNSFDAMQEIEVGERTVTVRASLVEDWVYVSVDDRGRGVPDGSEARLFDPFFTTKEGGLGMGLAISRTIVEAHDGRISMRSSPGEGTQATFTLPVYRDP